MIIQLEKNISEIDVNQLIDQLKTIGYKATEVKTSHGHYLVCIGSYDVDIRKIGSLKGIKDVHRLTEPYKLVSSKWKVNSTEIALGNDVTIGNGHFSVMAGPCSVENEKQIELIVEHLLKNNIKIIRGGVFKPRSSPYAFRGMGIEGLKMFYGIAKQNGLKVITEVMETSQIEKMMDFVDVFQVGARNSQNFNLLDELGRVSKPILLKRGISGTIDELLQSAEYIFLRGNEEIMLCERGIRTYETAYRNTFDINAISILKEKSHLPVIADPSHGIGIRAHVSRVALAAAIAGADGLIYEVHHTPEEALSDGQQTLSFDESNRLIKALNELKKIELDLI
jgi:3-deoxy-7-phosphoheptulonate synthase